MNPSSVLSAAVRKTSFGLPRCARGPHGDVDKGTLFFIPEGHDDKLRLRGNVPFLVYRCDDDRWD